MAKSLIKEYRFPNDFNYGKEMDIMIAYIKKYWNVSARPKGYKEFTEDYDDFKGMGTDNDQKLIDEFQGFNDEGASSFPFALRISLPQVAYDDKCQGRPPIRALLGAVFSYGMRYGMRYEEVGDNSDTHYRLSHISHCIHMIKYRDKDDDAEKVALYEQELEEYFKVHKDHMDVHDEFDKLRKRVDKKRAMEIIRRTIKLPLVLNQCKYKKLGKLWGLLNEINFGYFRSEHEVFTEMRKELRAEGINLTKKERTYIFKTCKIRKKKVGKKYAIQRMHIKTGTPL